MLAHGSGIDEIAIFVSVPLLYLAYYWGRRWWAARHVRVWPVPVEPAEQDEGEGDPGRPG